MMSISLFKPRLVLRVLWNTEFSAGTELVRHIYSRLCRDVERPASRGVGIPVYFHSGLTPVQAKLPAALEIDAADSTVVVPLIDTSIRADQSWRECIRDLEMRIAGHGRRHLFLPVACEDRVLSVVDKANCVRLYKFSLDERPDKLVSAITHELARLLLGKGDDVQTENFGTLERSFAPVKLFISHSKHGQEGNTIATELRDYGRQHFPIATFYDSSDIAAGHDFEKEIQANVADSAMVIVHTNSYSDRSWCRREVLFAKRYACPVLVVNAVTVGEDRLFPYLGNAPTVSWPFASVRRCEIVIDAAVREVLRNAYFLADVQSLKKAGFLPKTCVEIGTAPEMLTYRNLLHAKKCDRAKPSVLLYPDPPLGDEEIEVLEDLNPSNVTFTTPTGIAVQPQPSSAATPLNGFLIGLSISDSPDLSSRGMSQVHLEDAMVECARHLLANGASLAYGGDLRPGGFTTIVFELVRSHNRAGGRERIHNFLAWPIYLRLDSAVWREYLDEVRDHRIPPPADLGVDERMFIPGDSAGRYAWARSLTAMRMLMTDKIAARVLLGGQVSGFKGKYPGLLEEALLVLRAGKPLYLIGGLGGCTLAIVDALKGGTPEVFTEALQVQDPAYREVVERYRTEAAANKTTTVDYASEVKFLGSKGVGGLDNGLTNDENEILFSSKNLPEIVYLLLKGLAQRLRVR